MKKAFSLLELIFVIIISSIIFMIVFKPLENIYKALLRSSLSSAYFYDINHAFALLKKELDLCINISIYNNSLTCIQRNESLFLDENLRDNIGYSGILLKDKNIFFSPKSHFYSSYKRTSKGISSELKDQIIRKKNQSKDMIFYNYKDGLSYEVEAKTNKKDEIIFKNSSFTGFYAVINSNIKYFVEKNDLYFSFAYDNFYKKSLVLSDISSFELKKEKELLAVKICKKLFLKDQNPLCIERFYKVFI